MILFYNYIGVEYPFREKGDNMTNNLLGVSLNFGDGSVYNSVVAVLYVLCGLGIFLYGINMMGSSLKAIAGDKMKVIVAKGTNTPIKGVLLVAVVTAVIQSSSATSLCFLSSKNYN